MFVFGKSSLTAAISYHIYIYIYMLGLMTGFTRINGGRGQLVSYKQLGADTVEESWISPYVKQKILLLINRALQSTAALCPNHLKDCCLGNLLSLISTFNSSVKINCVSTDILNVAEAT